MPKSTVFYKTSRAIYGFSSNQGIYVYYPQTHTLKNLLSRTESWVNSTTPIPALSAHRESFFFGGGDGFNMIDPATVKQNPLQPKAFLSRLLINNKSLEEYPPKFVNAKFPTAINRIELASNQNTLTIGLVANSFIKSSANKFRYRIQHYLDEWIETTQGNDVVFTKIPPGNYILEVLASNNDGIWGKTAREFHIKIAPPFWLSWYAYLFYGLLIVGSAMIILRDCDSERSPEQTKFSFLKR